MQFKILSSSRDIKGLRILMRVDFNVPMISGKMRRGATQRIDRVAPEIIKLTKRGAKVILLAHLGRPNGKFQSTMSNKHLIRAISERVGQGVKFSKNYFGKEVENEIFHLKKGGVLLLENLRFNSGEESNNSVFAKKLAGLGDIYINNAFSVSHRKHASVNAITKYISSYAGDLLVEEVRELSKPLKKPLVIVLGGAKIKTKIGLLKKMGDEAEYILVGGGLASVLYASKINNWDYTKLLKIDGLDKKFAKEILKKYSEKLFLPSDVKVKISLKSKATHAVPIDAVPKKSVIVDIGPDTIISFRALLQDAGSVIWNGPLGIVELPDARKGSSLIAKAMSDLENARTIAGGGDILLMIDRLKLNNKLNYISTGGGAMLSFLSGEKLPGLIPLIK